MVSHLVYAKGLRTSAPYSITNELAARLRPLGGVRVYDLAEIRTIIPGPGDILLGHPHPDPRTVFQTSMAQPGWAKRAVMCPFSHGMPELNGWMDGLVEQADFFLAITGKFWFDTMDETAFSHWKYKSRRLDLAVNPKWFPAVKRSWNPAGKRRFLYVGHTGIAKGTDYLCALAEANDDLHFAWMGGGVMESGKVETLGACDFNLPESLRLVGTYDFLISCGRSDANPTTLLEALAWGLVPVCTNESGYRDEPWLVNVPSNNVAGASAVLRRLNEMPEEELNGYIARGRAALEKHFTWDRFAKDVASAIKEPAPTRPGDADWIERAAQNRAKLAAVLAGGAK